MQKTIAKILTVALHPLLMPVAFSYIYLKYATILVLNSSIILWFFAMIFTLTCLIPISSIPVLINMKIIENFKMNDHRERIFPLFITALSYYFTYFMLDKINIAVFDDLQIFILSATVILIISMLISYKWKISAHMIGIGGVTGGIIGIALKHGYDLQTLILILILLSGLVGFARLKLEAHTPKQVLAGYLLGTMGIIIPLLVL